MLADVFHFFQFAVCFFLLLQSAIIILGNFLKWSLNSEKTTDSRNNKNVDTCIQPINYNADVI